MLTRANASASPAGGSKPDAGPLCMRLFESLPFSLAWCEFENRDFRRTVQPDGVDRPADPSRNENSHPPWRSLEPAGVCLVSHRQDRRPNEGNNDLSTMRVPGNHEVDSGGELGISSVRIVREDDSAVGVRNPPHDLVEVTMVLPQVSSTHYPKPLPASFDSLCLMPQVLIGILKPLLRSSSVGPMIVISEHRIHAERSFEFAENRPDRVNLGGRRPLVYVVASADDQITLERIGSVDHVANDGERNKGTVVEVSKMHDSETRECLRQVRDLDPVMIG